MVMQRISNRVHPGPASLSTHCDATTNLIDRRRRVLTRDGRRRASLVNLDIAVLAGAVTVAAPGVAAPTPMVSTEKDEW